MRARAVILALAATLAVSPARAENVLRWASTTGAVTFDPNAAYLAPTIDKNHQVYEGLVDPTPATSWNPRSQRSGACSIR